MQGDVAVTGNPDADRLLNTDPFARLQYDKRWPYNRSNDLKQRFKFRV